MTSSQTSGEEYKIFNDSVHGHIQMHPLLVKIIDTPEFQRLRNIKQLGGGYFVFPGASHNRFEHSIGVTDLAENLVKVLRAHDEDNQHGITKEDELCVQVAGLCHDLGHGPFSHTFEDFMKKANPQKEWKHEQQSLIMFDHLIKKIPEHGLKPEDIEFIKALIYDPQETHKNNNKEKSFLYEIVANERTGIDVDKMDYFSRDCLHLGMKSNFSHERFMQFARVCTDENGEELIAMRDKEALNMCELFHVRYLLHHNAYTHRVTKAIEMMIVDALVAADKDGFMLENEIKILNAVDVPEAFLNLTDDILQKIKLSGKSEDAKAIIERIEKRDLYSCVGSKIFKPLKLKDLSSQMSRDDIVKKWFESIPRSALPEKKIKEMFEIKVIKISYGKEDNNPIDFLRFYKKDSKNDNDIVKLSVDQISYIQPDTFSERKVMLFYKGTDDSKPYKEAINSFWDAIQKDEVEEEGKGLQKGENNTQQCQESNK